MGGSIQILTESDLRDTVGLGAAELAAIEQVYPLISDGRARMPPVMRLDVPEHHGEVDVKSAHLPGHPSIAVKVSAGFFDNPALGLPSLGGLMVLLDSRTGVPRAVLFDNGYLTDLRTALAGAVAADHLAVRDADSVAVFGAGLQARLQIAALRLVRPIRQVTLWARRQDEGTRVAAHLGSELDGLAVRAVSSRPEAVAGAQILVTATPSTSPLVERDLLHPGLHVTAVGSDTEHKRELATDVLAAAEVVVCDHRGQSEALGELRAAMLEGFDPGRVVELGTVIGGGHPGRSNDRQVTVCDLTGTGAQDTAIASLAFTRCLEAGRGSRVET